MILTCITHADARPKKKYPFRGLTEQGWQEVKRAADRFRELFDEGTPRIEIIVSSPKARCMETALIFAKEISEYTATSELQLDPSLKAGSISGQELVTLANTFKCKHLLVSAHADLARALPAHVEIDSDGIKDGWFTSRPVLITIEYDVGDNWGKAKVKSCDGYVNGEWRNWLQP